MQLYAKPPPPPPMPTPVVGIMGGGSVKVVFVGSRLIGDCGEEEAEAGESRDEEEEEDDEEDEEEEEAD